MKTKREEMLAKIWEELAETGESLADVVEDFAGLCGAAAADNLPGSSEYSEAWWKEVFHELRWYAFLEDVPKKYVGHNPLAQVAMFFFMTVGITFMLLT